MTPLWFYSSKLLIFFRISQLLIGEEFRRDIANKSGIAFENLPLGHVWPDLDFSFNYTDPDDSFSGEKTGISPDVSQELENGDRQTADASENFVDFETSNQCKTNSVPELQENGTVLNGREPMIGPGDTNGELSSVVSNCDESDSSSDSFSSDDYQRCFMGDDEKKTLFRTKHKNKKTPRQQESNRDFFVPRSCIDDYFSSLDIKEHEIGPGPGVILQVACFFLQSD